MTLTSEQRQKIKDSFFSGQLKVKSVNPETGEVRLSQVNDVLRHKASHKKVLRVVVEDDEVIATEDHSLFTWDGTSIVPTKTNQLTVGTALVAVENNHIILRSIVSVEEYPSQKYMYDLSVPGDENFALANGILAHNSYSIGGVSLDLNKSSMYESLKSGIEAEFSRQLAEHKKGVLYIKGLSQHKYGMGLSSALGPFSGSGLQNRRNFLGSFSG